MIEKVNSEPSKTAFELKHVQRWEDDGGAVSVGDHPNSKVAKTSTPQSMDVVEKNDLLSVELNDKRSKGDKQVNPFVLFLASNTGRMVRIMGGLALVVLGRFGLSGLSAFIVMLIGAVPLLAGTFDICVIAPLFGSPLSGSKIRADN